MAVPGPTTIYCLDIPFFRDDDHDAGWYAAAFGTSAGWSGCAVYQSWDDGVSYQQIAKLTEAAVAGSADGMLSTGTAGAWDYTNTVNVTVRGTLDSHAEASAPLILIGNEIVKCQTATLVSSRGAMTTYTLSDLKRGLNGTDADVGTHVAGERVVLLNDSVARIQGNRDDIGSTMLIKAVSFGLAINDVSPVSFTNNGRGLYSAVGWEDLRTAPLSAKLAGVKDPSFAQFKSNGSGSTGVYVYWFSKTAEQEVFVSVQLPHSWKLGSDLYPHVHWVPKTNGTSGAKVSWGLEYSWADISGTFGNSSIIYSNTHHPSDTSLVASKHYTTSLPTISSPIGLSSVLVCRLFRDATGVGYTDDYDDVAGLMEFDIHYQIDTTGSLQETTK